MRMPLNERGSTVFSLLLVSLFILVGNGEASYGETYNFYFGKNKKKNIEEPAEVKAEEDADGEEGELEEGKSANQSKSNSLRMTRGPQPLIINNINNNENSIRNSVSVPGVARSKTSKAEQDKGLDSGAGIAASLETKKSYPPFRFALTATGAVDSVDGGVHYDAGTDLGLSVALGYAPSRSVEWRSYFGLQQELRTASATTPYAGLDFEFTPFRIGFAETWDLFRIGFFAGASTLAASPNHVGTLHVGTRATVQLGEGFGITTGLRANFGYLMLESGLAASL